MATYDRSQTLAVAERHILTILDTLQGHAEKVFQIQLLALGVIEERLRGQSNEDVLAAAASHHAYLRSLVRRSEETLGMVVIGADGRALVDAVQPEARRDLTVSDREYFRWHLEHPGPEPYVAGAARSRGYGWPAFFVTQRWTAADGSFLGVIADAVPQSIFIEYWNRAVPDRDAVVSIIRDDAVFLVRRPAVEPEERFGPPLRRQLAQAIRSAAERKVVQGTSLIDGIERLFAVRRLEHFPVYVTYGVPQATVLAPWHRRLLIYGCFTAAVAVALLSLVVHAKCQAREMHDLNASLEQRVNERTAEIQAGEARLRLLAREVDHRSKNVLAVVQATLRLTPKSDAMVYAEAVSGRVSALARAQTLLAEDRWRGASLQGLLAAELAPFVSRDGDQAGPWAELDGPPVLLPPVATQPLAMVAHELAMNALKYGALSVPGGRVTVSWRLTDAPGVRDDRLTLRWVETGGPAVAGPPLRRGFGSRIMESVVRGQIGGTLSLSWGPSGLVCEIEVPLARLAKAPVPGDDTGSRRGAPGNFAEEAGLTRSPGQQAT